MFVGSLAGGLIEAFVSRERMTSFLPEKGWLTVCIAAGAGIVFPVCECAVVPVVRRLIGKGLPLSAAIGYLLAGPIVNPIVVRKLCRRFGSAHRHRHLVERPAQERATYGVAAPESYPNVREVE